MAVNNRQRGVVLILVLWVVVLLSVIAGAVTVTQNAGVSMVSNMKNHREGRALVDAGIMFMMLNIGKPNKIIEDELWPIDGQLHPWVFQEQDVWVGAMPESSRIDLNAAPAELLQNLFVSVGVDFPDAEHLTDAILDWRDEDTARHINGFEDNDYRADGQPIGARDGKFHSVEELRQVFGITLEIYRAIESSLTVESRQSTVNPIYASPQVLAALPGMTALGIESYIELREIALLNGVTPPMPDGVDARFVRSGSIAAFRLFAEVTSREGVVTQEAAIVRIDKVTPNGYSIIASNYSPATMPAKAPLLEAGVF